MDTLLTHANRAADHSFITNEENSKVEFTPRSSNNYLVDDHIGNLVIKSLPKNILKAIQPHLRREYVRKEQYLFQQDDQIETIYFPETAVVSELHLLDDGKMVEIAIIGREGSTGIATLYKSGCRITNCVQVTQGGSVLKIESSILKKLSLRHPEMLPLLQISLENYIRQISQKAVCNMYHSIAQRLCTWLLMVTDRSAQKNLKLTHEHIARTLGVYRPSITCIALDMRKKKMIDYSRGIISIMDRARLEDMACNCYAEIGDLTTALKH